MWGRHACHPLGSRAARGNSWRGEGWELGGGCCRSDGESAGDGSWRWLRGESVRRTAHESSPQHGEACHTLCRPPAVHPAARSTHCRRPHPASSSASGCNHVPSCAGGPLAPPRTWHDRTETLTAAMDSLGEVAHLNWLSVGPRAITLLSPVPAQELGLCLVPRTPPAWSARTRASSHALRMLSIARGSIWAGLSPWECGRAQRTLLGGGPQSLDGTRWGSGAGPSRTRG